MLPDLVIGGIPVIAIIIGLVEYIKSWGLGSKYAALVAMSLGILASVTVQLTVVYPGASPWVEAVVIGLVIGMSATGLYKVGNRWLNSQ